MKFLRKPKFIVLTIILSLFLYTSLVTFSANADPNELTINTDDVILGKVYYDNFSIIAKNINAPNGIAYCLEIDKDYPNGESFVYTGEVSPEVKNILTCGYPNTAPSDLNLISEEDAYFATQIAIWCSIEGYDVSKITGDRPEIVAAINTIYTNSINFVDNNLRYNIDLFFSVDRVQDIAVVSYNPSTAIEEAPIGK